MAQPSNLQKYNKFLILSPKCFFSDTKHLYWSIFIKRKTSKNIIYTINYRKKYFNFMIKSFVFFANLFHIRTYKNTKHLGYETTITLFIFSDYQHVKSICSKL